MDTPLDLGALQDAIFSLGDGLEVVSDPIWFKDQADKVQNTLISGVVKASNLCMRSASRC